jgi:hypothetical protein
MLMICCVGLRYSACGTTSLGSFIRKWTSWDTFLLVNCLRDIFIDPILIFKGRGANRKSDIDWPKVSFEKGNPSNNEDLGKTTSIPEEKPQIPSKDISANKIPSSTAKVC